MGGWTVTETPHAFCHRSGKFDCDQDERVHGITMDASFGEADGDVEAPTGWFARIYLQDVELAEHYGSAYVLATEDENGFFRVQGSTADATLKEFDRLTSAYWEWADPPTGCPGHPDDDNSILAGMPSGVTHYCDGSCQ